MYISHPKGKTLKRIVIKLTRPSCRVFQAAFMTRSSHRNLYSEIPSQMFAGWSCCACHRPTPTDRSHGKLQFNLLNLISTYPTGVTVSNYNQNSRVWVCLPRCVFLRWKGGGKNVKNMSASRSEMWSEGSYCLVQKRRARTTKVQKYC